MPRRKLNARSCFVLALFVGINIYFVSKQRAVTTQPRGRQDAPRLVVSLTTIPSRIHLLQKTLQALIDSQLLKPHIVYLTLPKKKRPNKLLNYTIPAFIQDYQRKGTLKILTPEWDYGPVSKVFYTLMEEEADTRIVYVDDDVIYPPTLLQNLWKKSLEYPKCVLCFSGGVLRDYFRQIGHSSFEKNRHPYLFLQTSGTPVYLGEGRVEICQGFMGVLVKPSWFHVDEMRKMLEEPDIPAGVLQSDDFILSGHLARHNITRMLVDGGTAPDIHKQASQIDKLSHKMHNHAMEAAWFLQQHWGIWTSHHFYNPTNLSVSEKNAIDCEAGHSRSCVHGWQKVLAQLNEKYPPNG